MSLENRVAIVTGGARGIGAAIVQSLIEAGARVGIVDLQPDIAERAQALYPERAVGVRADASEEAAMSAAVEQVAAHFGGLDLMINNAGGGRPGSGLGNPFTRVTQADWDEQLALNLRSSFAGSKAAIPHLLARGGGAILNISSVAGQVASPTTPAYGAAKAAVNALTRTLALELAGNDIRVNAICPGLVWTDAWENLARLIKAGVPHCADMEPREIFLAQVRQSVPSGREQTPEDVAALAAFLCSDAAASITGQVISVDGGLTVKIGS